MPKLIGSIPGLPGEPFSVPGPQVALLNLIYVLMEQAED